MVDYRQLKRIWWVPLGIAVVMLVLVLNRHFGVVPGHGGAGSVSAACTSSLRSLPKSR